MAKVSKKNQDGLTQERFREQLEYCKTTGKFYWLISTARRVKVGDIAGCLDKHGYVRIMIDGVSFPSHRLAWFYHYKVWPDKVIDHINGNTADNRIENLRDVSMKTNAENSSKYKRTDPNLPTGVGVGRRSKDGTPTSYMAYWQGVTSKSCFKWFNVKKHGSDEDTITAASAYREQVIVNLITQGAEYTQRHGKDNKGE